MINEIILEMVECNMFVNWSRGGVHAVGPQEVIRLIVLKDCIVGFLREKFLYNNRLL